MSFPWPSFKKFVPLGVCLAVALLLFTRSPSTNFVFDEQEALLANPYLDSGMPFYRLFHVDFWGRTPEQSIGSYRPLPNALWRLFAFTLKANTPLYLQLINVVLHAVVATRLGKLCLRLTGNERAAWITALTFVAMALSTEVVSGVVGLADILAALCGVLLLDAAIGTGWRRLLGVFAATFLGLLSKETSICFLSIAVLGTLAWSETRTPLRRAGLVLIAQALGLVSYVTLRRTFFPVAAPQTTSALSSVPGLGPVSRAFLAWFQQPGLPADPINNPLVGLGLAERLPSVFAVFARGLGQLLVPHGLSGDYSFAQSTVERWSWLSVLGASAFAVALLAGMSLLRTRKKRTDSSSRRLLGWGLLIVLLAYLPVSNLLVLLPTIRADRLWYLPTLGVCLAVGALSSLVPHVARTAARVRLGVLAGGLAWGFQCYQARSHAFDYTTDLTFWRATARAAPRSAKAQLNLGVMLGARKQPQARIDLTRRATELAPDWPMAHIYLGDAFCRENRLAEAWPHYRRGFEKGPNQRGLLALALQCLWDHQAYAQHRVELLDLGEQYPKSWLAYLAHDLDINGETNDGVNPQYRPRSYNQKANDR